MKKSTLKFEVDLDENHLPTTIIMNSSDKSEEDVMIKSLMVSAWDSSKQETLKLDLWTKDMMVNEMYMMYHQTLLTLYDTLKRSTGNEKLAGSKKEVSIKPGSSPSGIGDFISSL